MRLSIFAYIFVPCQKLFWQGKHIGSNENKRYEWKRMTKEYEWDKINKYRFKILLLLIENYFNYIVFAHFHRRKLHKYDDTSAKE